MNKSPAFQFYPKDYLSDPKVIAMDWDARGMHVHCMCIAWGLQPECRLPDDDDYLWRLVGKPEGWDRLKPQIFRAWVLEDDGFWVQKRLLREWQAQQERRAKKKAAADSRWDTYRRNADAVQPQCPSSPSSPSSPTPKKKIKKSDVTRPPASFPVGVLVIVDRLKTLIEKKTRRDLPPGTRDKWAVHIDKLHWFDGIGVARQGAALTEYEANYGRMHWPEIQTGQAWRDKFQKLENAIAREKAEARNPMIPEEEYEMEEE